MKRASQGPGVVNALMQGDAHAVRDMGACGDQYGKMEETPGGKAPTIRSERGGELKTMVLRAAAHKSHLPPKGSTTRDAVARRSSERCI